MEHFGKWFVIAIAYAWVHLKENRHIFFFSKWWMILIHPFDSNINHSRCWLEVLVSGEKGKRVPKLAGIFLQYHFNNRLFGTGKRDFTQRCTLQWVGGCKHWNRPVYKRWMWLLGMKNKAKAVMDQNCILSDDQQVAISASWAQWVMVSVTSFNTTQYHLESISLAYFLSMTVVPNTLPEQ